MIKWTELLEVIEVEVDSGPIKLKGYTTNRVLVEMTDDFLAAANNDEEELAKKSVEIPTIN